MFEELRERIRWWFHYKAEQPRISLVKLLVKNLFFRAISFNRVKPQFPVTNQICFVRITGYDLERTANYYFKDGRVLCFYANSDESIHKALRVGRTTFDVLNQPVGHKHDLMYEVVRKVWSFRFSTSGMEVPARNPLKPLNPKKE